MTPYEVLELPADASPMEAQEAYQRLAKQWHPDRFVGAQREVAQRRFNLLGEAYAQLNQGGAGISLATDPSANSATKGLSVHAAFAAAKVAWESNDLARAQTLLDHVITLEPDRVEFYLLLARVLDVPGGDVRKLVQTLETVMRLDRKQVDAAIRLAELYQSIGLHTRATRMWETVRLIAPGHKLFQATEEKGPGALDRVKELGGGWTTLMTSAKALFKR